MRLPGALSNALSLFFPEMVSSISSGGAPRGGDNYTSLFQVLEEKTLVSVRGFLVFSPKNKGWRVREMSAKECKRKSANKRKGARDFIKGHKGAQRSV